MLYIGLSKGSAKLMRETEGFNLSAFVTGNSDEETKTKKVRNWYAIASLIICLAHILIFVIANIVCISLGIKLDDFDWGEPGRIEIINEISSAVGVFYKLLNMTAAAGFSFGLLGLYKNATQKSGYRLALACMIISLFELVCSYWFATYGWYY